MHKIYLQRPRRFDVVVNNTGASDCPALGDQKCLAKNLWWICCPIHHIASGVGVILLNLFETHILIVSRQGLSGRYTTFVMRSARNGLLSLIDPGKSLK